MKPENSKMPLPPMVEEWLGERSASERSSLEKTWRLAEAVGPPPMDMVDRRRKAEVWSTLSTMMSDTEREEMPRPRLQLVKGPIVRGNAWPWMAAAAAVAILVCVAYVLRPVTVHAPRGEVAQVHLPDGSVAHLNSGSSVTYRAHFIGSRSVELEGEAFFEVTKDEAPFVVETFNATTTVLGTKFNVRARSDEPTPTTSVVVATGRVRLDSKAIATDGVILTAGLESRVGGRSAASSPTPTSVDRALAWREGGFAFNDQPFAVIFSEIERRYAVEVDAPPAVLRENFTYFAHDRKSADVVMADLAQASGMRYRKTANGYEMYRP